MERSEPRDHPPHAKTASGSRIRVFVSYDRECDGDLYALLAEQASDGIARFEISGRSPNGVAMDEALRRAIRDADQVIVLCGTRTASSDDMGVELRIAQEEKRPYLLLWGRRELMCTKPATSRSADAMYSWTEEILERQLLMVLREPWAREPLNAPGMSRGARPGKPASASLAPPAGETGPVSS